MKLSIILFYDVISLNFLIPGYSHMAADRVVSWVRRSVEKNNVYVLEQLFEKVNRIKNTNAADALKFKFYKGCLGILSKYFKKIHTDYTKYYYFELNGGVYRIKFYSGSQECIEFKLCEDPTLTKTAVMHKLFEESSILDIIR